MRRKKKKINKKLTFTRFPRNGAAAVDVTPLEGYGELSGAPGNNEQDGFYFGTMTSV